MDLIKRRTRTPDVVLWRDFDDFPNRVRQLLAGRFAPELLPDAMTVMPPIELIELDDELMLTAELPGLAEADVEILFEEGMLTLKGEKKAEAEEKNPRYHVWERSYGSFTRSFAVPRTVDPAGIRADFENGVLTVHMPKTKEAVGRRIEIAPK